MTPDSALDRPYIDEPRWPWLAAMTIFVCLNVALRLWLPDSLALGIPWIVPVFELLLMIALLADDPGSSIERRRLRRIQISLASLLVVSATSATGLLIYDLITASSLTNNAAELLAAGAVIWLGNILAFSLLYWLTDGGGPVPRSQLDRPVDFAFVQHTDREVSPDGWKPVYLDYLHLAFTNATAFSPTDVMPLSHRAKYTMVLQSSVALALVALIIARSVNAFT